MFTHDHFISELHTLQSDEELRKIKRYFKSGEGEYGYGDTFLGVRMGLVFDLARKYVGMPLNEVEKLLESHWHEARTGAVSIMDFQARSKKCTESRRKELYELYIRRQDRINNWDLVDRSAIWVVGRYLHDKPKDILYELARSENMWERRTAIVATAYFLKQKNSEHTFRIAELFLDDPQDLIHKAAGSWIRMAGNGTNRQTLIDFLDKHAHKMPRVMLRHAIEKLDKNQREYYLKIKKM